MELPDLEEENAALAGKSELPDINEENAALSDRSELPDLDEANAELSGKSELPDLDEANAALAGNRENPSIEKGGADLDGELKTDEAAIERQEDVVATEAEQHTAEDKDPDTHWQEMDDRAGKFNLGDRIMDAARGVAEIGDYLKTSKEARFGKELSGICAVLANTPVIGTNMEAEQNRQMLIEEKLAKGEFSNTLEMSRAALTLGIPQETIKQITDAAAGDAAKARQYFSELVLDDYEKRQETRAEKSRQARDQEKNLNWLQKQGAGAVGLASTVVNMTPVAAPFTIGADAANRASELHDAGADGNDAMVKGLVGAEAERLVWGAKLLNKIPFGDKISRYVDGGAGKWLKKNASELLGMVAKTRLTELIDDVGGMKVQDGVNVETGEDQRTLGEWARDSVSLKKNGELLLELLPVHFGMKAVRRISPSGLAAAKSRKERAELLERYGVDKDRVGKLSDDEIDSICRFLANPNLTEEKFNRFVDYVAKDADAGAEKLAAAVDMSAAAKEQKFTPEQEMAIDEIAPQFNGDDAKLNGRVKERIRQKLADEAVNGTPEGQTPLRERLNDPAEVEAEVNRATEEVLMADNYGEIAKSVNRQTLGTKASDRAAQLITSMPRTADKDESRIAGEIAAADPEISAERVWELAEYIAAHGRGTEGAGADPLTKDRIAEIEREIVNDKAGVVPVEQPDGTFKTVNEVEAEAARDERKGDVHPEGEAATEAPVSREQSSEKPVDHSADWAPVDGKPGSWHTSEFPEVEISLRDAAPEEGVKPDGSPAKVMFIDNLPDPDTLDEAGQLKLGKYLLEQVDAAARIGVEKINAGRTPEEAAKYQDLVDRYKNSVQEEKFKVQADVVVGLLRKSGLAKEIVGTEDEFNARLAALGDRGHALIADGETYGFTDGTNVYLNPAFFATRRGVETPIHEFGHLAIIATKNVNRPLYDRGIELIKQTSYWKYVSEHPDYAGLSDEYRAHEALTRLIADGGQRLDETTPKGVLAEIKKFIVEVWKSFGNAMGIRDLTPEQIEKMTVGEIADVIRAEMESGRRFGESHVSETSFGRVGEKVVSTEANPVGSGEISLSRKLEIPMMAKAREKNEELKLVDATVMAMAGQHRAMVRTWLDEMDPLFLPEDKTGKTTFGNASYGRTKENTTVCTRTIGIRSLSNAVAEYMGRPLTVQEQLYVAQMAMNYTDKPQCLYCYVAMDRMAKNEYYGAYVDQMDSVIRKLRAGQKASKVYASFLDGRKDTPQMRARFKMWSEIAADDKLPRLTKNDVANDRRRSEAMSGDERLALQMKDAEKYAQSASWAKKYEEYRAYDGDILKWPDRAVKQLNKHFGLRMYSFSEFSPAFILENMQMITDASVRGLKVLWYTKEADAVKIFGNTGAAFNMGVFAHEDPKTHEMTCDGMQGMDWNTAKALREKYKNAGVVFVATNDRQVEWAGKQEWIDVIIPYHIVRTGSKIAQMMGWKNYKEDQADMKDPERWKPGMKKTIYPSEHNNDRSTYFDLLRENGLKPRFEKWVNEPWYMKLVNETRQASRDMASVQPVFDIGEAEMSLDGFKSRGGYFERIGVTPEREAKIAMGTAERLKAGAQPGGEVPPIQLSRGRMTPLAKAKVGEAVEGTTAESVRNAVEQKIEKGLVERDYRFKSEEDRKRLVRDAVRFYKRFSQKTIMLSDGRIVYFVPDSRAKNERGLNNDEAWAEYAIHAVTSSGEKIEGKQYSERLYNHTKAENIWRLEGIIKAERCEAKIDRNPDRDGVIFYGRGVDGKTIQIITRLDDAGNVYADLTEVTVINGGKRKELPPPKPLTEVVRTVANRRQRGGLLTADIDSVPQSFQSGNGGLMLSRGNGARIVGGMTRVAADEDHGERTPGGMAAARELEAVRNAPVNTLGTRRFMSLPISDLEELRKIVSENVHPTHVSRTASGASRTGGQVAKGDVSVWSDTIGITDHTDAEAEKANLKQHGFFRDEDPNWCSGQTDAAIRAERIRSEKQLARQLDALGERRVRGIEPGGQTAERGVFADEVAKVVLAQERQVGGRLGRLQTIGKSVQDAVANMPGMTAADAEDSARRFLDWSYGQPNYSQNMSGKRLTAEMFGKWLIMPRAVQQSCPEWANAIEGTIASDPKLANAFRTLADRRLNGDEYLMRRIRKQMDRQTEEALRELNSEKDEEIGAGSWFRNFEEKALFGLHDTFAPVYVRMDYMTRVKIKAMKAAIRAANPAARPALRQQLDLYMGDLGNRLKQLELSRTAYERGTINEGSVYHREMVRLENEAHERWGLTTDDMSFYLDQWRVIETGGRSASFGEDVRQARKALDEMEARLGPQKWIRMQEYGNRFFAIHERELLNDPRAEKMFGKAFVDYLRTQTHYVATERTFSVEERDAIETARRAIRRSGARDVDDVISQMYDYSGSKGAGEAIGEKDWTGRLSGSMAAKIEVRAATFKKVDRLQRALRRNQFVLDLRDALTFAGVTGVRDLPRIDGANYPDGSRYGHINYLENGEKRTLVVPKHIADAFKGDPVKAKWYSTPVRMIHNAWRSVIIDYNPAYRPMNIRRNIASIEKNMPGMRETWAKTVLRGVFPGLGTMSDLVFDQMVKRIPASAKLFSDHTYFHYVPQMERICRILESPSEWQKKYWGALDANNLGKISQMDEDWRLAKEMLRANMFVSIRSSYANEKSTSFAAEALAKKGLKTLEEIDRQLKSRTWKQKGIDTLLWALRKNQQLTEHDDMMAKGIAYLADRTHYGLVRTAKESGDLVDRRVSIAQGERKGSAAGTLKLLVPFYNMIEKGVVRHWNAYGTDFGHTLAADGKFLIGSACGMLMAKGLAQLWMLRNSDNDEEKARKKFGKFYDYAKDFHDAYRNCSEYVRKNYSFTPLWTDGYTSVILGGSLTDEEKLLNPIVNFTVGAIAASEGLEKMPSLGSTFLDMTVRSVVPDLQMTGPLVEGIRLAYSAVSGENYEDYFRGTKAFDQKALDMRFESWEDFKDFSAAVGGRAWNYFGGRSMLEAPVNGVDNGRGTAPESLETILKRIPWVSPVINRMVKIQVGSPERDGSAVRARSKEIDGAISKCAERLLKMRDGNIGYHEGHPKEYEEKLSEWQNTYGLSDYEMKLVRVKYLNALNQVKCVEKFDERKVKLIRREAKRQGCSEELIYIQLGER